MSDIGKPERATQARVIALFRDELGYRYPGDWADRDGNSNIEEGLLTAYLTRNGYTPEQIGSAIYKLRTEADNHNRGLYGNNKVVYNLLLYGVGVKIEAGKVTDTVHLINWQEPEKNDFAIAKEVTLRGSQERRPDIVLYLNGIAIGIIELKTAASASAKVSARAFPTSGLSSMSGSSAQCNSSSPVTIPRACDTALFAPRRNIF